jgi:hypothetical protein
VEQTDFAMVAVGDKVMLRFNKLVSMSIATQIMVLLNGTTSA